MRRPTLNTISFIAWFLLAVTNVGLAQSAEAGTQRIQWQGIPISVTLSVGEERRIQFPAPVSVGVPASLQALLRLQTVNGTAYLLAHGPFAETRILVREIDSGRTYLMDLQAGTDAGANGPLLVTVGSNDDRATLAAPLTNADIQHYVTLTRFAAQQLYAPLRLLKPLPGVARMPLRQGENAPLLGRHIVATPLMAWRAGDLYLTAIKLQNRSDTAQNLDPRSLRGNWLSATFQHARLLPAGHVADSTALYLVSAQPFDQSH